jgi:hypothetical protein
MSEYVLFNQILDAIHEVLSGIMKDQRLSHANIERWRWDMPDIALTWLGKDVIWRNITTLITEVQPGGKKPQGFIEVNAWHDERRKNSWVRCWKHETIENGRVAPERWCHKAYETVISWNKKMLENQHSLSEQAAAVLETMTPKYKS